MAESVQQFSLATTPGISRAPRSGEWATASRRLDMSPYTMGSGYLNIMTLTPLVVSRSYSIDAIGYNSNTAYAGTAPTVRMGMYASDTDHMPTGPTLFQVTKVMGTGTGFTYSSVSYTLPEGPLWLAMVFQYSTAPTTWPTLWGLASSSSAPLACFAPGQSTSQVGKGYNLHGVTGSLPTLAGAATNNIQTANAPICPYIRAA